MGSLTCFLIVILTTVMTSELRVPNEVQDMPDIPSWMFYRFDEASQTGLLYGSPVSDGDIELEVIALNERTYDTSQDSLKLTVVEREKKAKYEAELKFTNLNVEDVYLENKTRDILQIFREKLWKDSSSVYVTRIVAPTDVGGRIPVDPKDKEGIIVRIGSVDFFSRDLLDLEREVTQLKNRTPCPRKYKATSAEHLFHKNHNDFQNDWCSFQLIRL